MTWKINNYLKDMLWLDEERIYNINIKLVDLIRYKNPSNILNHIIDALNV